jgi:hypothetical protein
MTDGPAAEAVAGIALGTAAAAGGAWLLSRAGGTRSRARMQARAARARANGDGGSGGEGGA